MNKIAICAAIQEKRPKLASSSVKTYATILYSNYRKIFPEDKHIDMSKFNDAKVFLEFLKEKPSATRKTILAALYVLTENKAYHELMVEDASKYDDLQKQQVMTEKQKANWMSMAEIGAVIDRYRSQAAYLSAEAKIRPLENKEFSIWQDYIILCLCAGKYFPPRRAKDWTDFKLKNVGESDNYLEVKNSSWFFVFQSYKTAKNYGIQRIACPKDLKAILQPFIKYASERSEFLLNDCKWKGIVQIQLTQRLNRIFGKNISVSMLRHIYLTDRYQNGHTSLAELSTTAKEMAHSVEQALEYVKLKSAPSADEEDVIPKPTADVEPDSPKPAKKRGRPRKVAA